MAVEDFDTWLLKEGGLKTWSSTTPWVQTLKEERRSSGATLSGENNSEEATRKHLAELFEARNSNGNATSGSKRNGIPEFYKPKPNPSSLPGRLDRLARLKFLKKQEECLLKTHELEALWACLKEKQTMPNTEECHDRINYDDFCKVATICEEKIGAKVKRFFTAATFLTFESDSWGRISILPFYLYIMRWVSLTQSRMDMAFLDRDDDGFLSTQEIEMYIRQLVPNLKLLGAIEDDFLDVYCTIAVAKFRFFCDPQGRGKVPIREVLLSSVLSELMELRQEDDELKEAPGNLSDNWFSLESTRRVYNLFLSLDSDNNGTLSKSELMAFGNGTLTDIFIERVFDEHLRQRPGHPPRSRRLVVGRKEVLSERAEGAGEVGRDEGDEDKGIGEGMRDNDGSERQELEMDLASFLSLLMALENRASPEGLAYLFRCLDVSNRGFLTAADVYTMFRSVHKKWTESGNYELAIHDVKDEIWDMVRPQDPLRITMEDLVRCQQGHTVASMLIDVAGFWTHDSRETLAAQQGASTES
eukprot:TRINITY_DN1390_c0_g1_i1.p1 TRINITY_DN1390_c0_g1~~TRINITY_DN1390_c0_g1_i1.p1  ORF type:complete len:530 (-),score=94.29 TRINITY_DN1390_c0_g1_i1:693-2282(-)